MAGSGLVQRDRRQGLLIVAPSHAAGSLREQTACFFFLQVTAGPLATIRTDSTPPGKTLARLPILNLVATHRMSALKLAAAVMAAFAVVFAISGFYMTGTDAPLFVAAMALAGALFGGIAAPEIAPRSFRRAAWWQVGFATLGCLLVAALLGAGVEGFGLALVLGILIGWLAPVWVRHVTVP